MSIGSSSKNQGNNDYFTTHPEFESGIDFLSDNKLKWSQYGYAISKELFENKIWRIEVKFSELPATAWLGVLQCDVFPKGNVHDRTRLCAYQSSGFCSQSGKVFGNHNYDTGDVIGLEINLTKPYSDVPFKPDNVGLGKTIATFRPANAKSKAKPKLNVSEPMPLSVSKQQLLSPHPSHSTASSTFEAAVAETKAPVQAIFATPENARTPYTLHFFVNGILQPVYFINVPALLRFIVYANAEDTECQILSLTEVKTQDSIREKLNNSSSSASASASAATPVTAVVYDPDEKGFEARAVGWNPTEKREDR